MSLTAYSPNGEHRLGSGTLPELAERVRRLALRQNGEAVATAVQQDILQRGLAQCGGTVYVAV